MGSRWITLLLLHLFLLPVLGYKLPVLDPAHLTTLNGAPLDDPNSSPPGKATQWEWVTLDNLEQGSPRLVRMKREDTSMSVDVMPEVSSATISDTLMEATTGESPLDGPSEATSHIIPLPSTTEESVTSLSSSIPHSTHLLIEDETTPIYEHKLHSQSTPEAAQQLTEDETTPLSHTDSSNSLIEEGTEGPHTNKSTGSPELLSTLSTSSSPEVTVNTTEGFKEVTSSSDGNILMTVNQSTNSPKSGTSHVMEDATSAIPSESSSNPQSPSTLTLTGSTTGLDAPTGTTPDPSTISNSTMAVAYMTASIEHPIHLQSIMNQCMLAILILGILCAIFIICTIVLAAKLSTSKNHYKRQQQNHTEMMCISTLLPESDLLVAKSKLKTTALKTFAANVEDSDGDNTTLNSFLPDH
ncbi:P-selectin glycoprotein ligand 1 [Ascaphus truei]|uniref:P-selectin glycoprotein ligand 1 n=1 Tax=Ascaphus truei TaxID=8439 RepID=UPI003F5980C9